MRTSVFISLLLAGAYLLFALLELDQIQKDPKATVTKKAIVLENDNGQTTMSLENW